MLYIILIFLISLLPSLLYLYLMTRMERDITYHRQRSRRYQRFIPPPPNADSYYVEGIGYLIGDISCQFNARSPYIRCAINPSGPCDSCRHYQSTL